MNIHGIPNDGPQPGDVYQAKSRLTKTNSAQHAVPRSHLNDSSAASGMYSNQLMQLAKKLKAAPEIRDDVVARIAQRLTTGFYSSREAAEQTAAKLRGSSNT